MSFLGLKIKSVDNNKQVLIIEPEEFLVKYKNIDNENYNYDYEKFDSKNEKIIIKRNGSVKSTPNRKSSKSK